MNDLLSLIKRFQSLKDITGTSKSSSYSVSLHFDPWGESVQVEFGGYDVGEWKRHEGLVTDVDNLLVDFEAKVVEAERIVKEWEQDNDLLND